MRYGDQHDHSIARDRPSSRLVPAMNGTLENFPAARSLDGRSGMIPLGPSRTGANMNGSGRDEIVAPHAERRAVVSAVCIQDIVASWVTPRLGGVGPTTVAMLLRNTVAAAEAAYARAGT